VRKVFWLLSMPLLCSLAFAQGGVIGPKGIIGPNGIVAPGTVSVAYYPVDVFVTMNGTTTGTAVSAGNLATGSVGTYSSWTAATSGETFHASQASLTGSITVTGFSTYPASTATQSLAQDNTVSGQQSQLNISTSKTKATISGWIYPNMTAGGFAFYDLVYLVNNNGNTLALQIDNQSPAVIRLEGAGGGESTTRCSNTTISLATLYWFSMQADWTSGTPQGQFKLYTVSGTSYTQVATCTVALVSTTPNSLQYASWGNAEAGADGGATYFQDMMLDYTNAVWPNIAH
jgi:hypothetical protein